MQNSRTNNSIINSSIAMTTQFITILLQFLMQTVFIHTLGATYLGINGLFQNVLAILAFSELGIGNAITFSLYIPLRDKDEYKIHILMNFFKKAYTVIGATVFVLTLVMMPFIHTLVKGADDIGHLQLYFFLYAMKSVVSYFFSYKRTLLIADQKGYKSNLNLFFFNLFQSLFQMFVLIRMHSFLLFLIIQIVFTLFSNIKISQVANKEYPFLKEKNTDKLPKKDLEIIKKSTLGLVGTQIGAIVVSNTNNLLISAFVGVFYTGIFSSYTMIQQGVRQIINQAMDSIISSIGNLAAESNLEKSRIIFKRHQFLSWTISYFCSLFFITLFHPFITIWLGKDYVFPFYIEWLIVLNFYISQNRKTPLSFIMSYGLFEKAGKKAILEAILNLVICFVLLVPFKMGIVGVLLGTTAVNILLNIWFEPWLVYRDALMQNIKSDYFIDYTKKFVFTVINISLLICIVSFVDLSNFLNLVVTFIITLAYGLISYILVYRKTDGFEFIYNIIKQIFRIILGIVKK